MQAIVDKALAFEAAAQLYLEGAGSVSEWVTYILRFVFPVLALVIFIRCLLPLMAGHGEPRPWGWLHVAGGGSIPLTHWESSLGSAKTCDIYFENDSVARNHAVILKRKEGWYITGLQGEFLVNGELRKERTPIGEEDAIFLGGLELRLEPADDSRAAERSAARRTTRWAAGMRTGLTLQLILLFQMLGLVQNTFALGAEFSVITPVAFLLYFLLEIFYVLFTHKLGRRYIEPELLAFFLCGLGLFVIAAVNPITMFKQFIAILLGILLFLVLTFFLNNLDRARAARYIFAAGALALLALNLILAQTRFGARNWITIGGFSLQPSEFVKVAFVFAGGATLDRLLTSRNLLMFMGFSGAIVGALVLMRDFGTALVFYAAFIVIAYMRSGDVRTLAVVLAITAVGVVLVISFYPYIASRFSAWRHAWEFVDTAGYQQTRTMIYTASGGLLGVGSGSGFLRYVAAADTDLVFGLVAEEWGLIIALVCALTPLALAIFSARAAKSSRSSFYAIVACGASVIFLTQAALNVFGSLDILPLTGVTLPFISNGGSSMVACWGLLACIKSIDERHRSQNLDTDWRGLLGGAHHGEEESQ